MLDLTTILGEVSPDSPAGENLEFDPDFGALERATQGKGEQQYGDTVVPAEAPDWKDVEAQASALLQRTRDLRILGHLGVARLQLTGLSGFASVLACTRQLLDTMWVPIHPQLDPDDDNDPTLRANALLRLGETGRVLKVLRDLPLAMSPRAGRVSWRDIGYAIGALDPPEDREKPTEAFIRGAFQDADQVRLAQLREDLAAAIDNVGGIPAAFDTHAGYGTGPDLSELLKQLRELQRYVDRFAPVPGEPAGEMAADVQGPGEIPATAKAGPMTGMSAASLTAINSRDDAMRLLDLVRDYYERYEPSSPLPFLLERARRLADKNFVDIMRDIAPDGLNQAQNVMGVRDE